VNDLAKLVASGAVPAGPAPLPPIEDGHAIEIERLVSRGGLVCLGPHRLLAAEILGGQLAGIRIEPATLMFYDPTTRVLLRTRPNPLTPDQAARLRGARPAGPPSRPPSEPVRVQRRASATGVIVVCGQKIALGRIHADHTVGIAVSETTLAIELDDAESRVIRRTTTTWRTTARPTTAVSSPVCGAANCPPSPTAAPGSRHASWPSPRPSKPPPWPGGHTTCGTPACPPG